MKPQVRVEEWYISGHSLCGRVYNHPFVEDGESIVSNRLVILELGRNYAETKDLAYILGEPVKVSEVKTINDTTM
jgi:hypothetical protein